MKQPTIRPYAQATAVDSVGVKNTGVDAAQDDNGHEDGTNGMIRRRQKFSDIKLGSRDPIFYAVENRKGNHQCTQRDAGNNSCHEHTATDTPVAEQYVIITVLGGIIVPSIPAAAIVDRANLRL